MDDWGELEWDDIGDLGNIEIGLIPNDTTNYENRGDNMEDSWNDEQKETQTRLKTTLSRGLSSKNQAEDPSSHDNKAIIPTSLTQLLQLKMASFKEIVPNSRPMNKGVSSSNHNNYIIVPKSYLFRKFHDDIHAVSDLLCLSADAAFSLLFYHSFDVNRANEAIFADRSTGTKNAGLNDIVSVHPSLLHSIADDLHHNITQSLESAASNAAYFSKNPIQVVGTDIELPRHSLGPEGYSFEGDVLVAQCCSAYCSPVPLDEGAFLTCGHFFCDSCWSNYLSTVFKEGYSAFSANCMGMSCGVQGDGSQLNDMEEPNQSSLVLSSQKEHVCSAECKCRGALPFSLFLRYTRLLSKSEEQDQEPDDNGVIWISYNVLDHAMMILIDRYVSFNKSVRWCPSPTCSAGSALAKATSRSLLPSSHSSYTVATFALKKPPTFDLLPSQLDERSMINFWVSNCPATSPKVPQTLSTDPLVLQSQLLSNPIQPSASFLPHRVSHLFYDKCTSLFSTPSLSVSDLESPLYCLETSPGSVTSVPVDCLCGHSYCFLCGETDHFPLPCDLFKSWIRGTVDTSTDELLVNAHCKNCPKCKVPISKDKHCNHMTCRMCNHEFCWVCLDPFRSPLNVGNSPHYSCNKLEVGASKETLQVENNRKQANEIIIKHNVYYTRFAQHWINATMLRNLLFLLEYRVSQMTPMVTMLNEFQEGTIRDMKENMVEIEQISYASTSINLSTERTNHSENSSVLKPKFLKHFFPQNVTLILTSMTSEHQIRTASKHFSLTTNSHYTLQHDMTLQNQVAHQEAVLGASLSHGLYVRNSFDQDTSRFAFLGQSIRSLIESERVLQWTYAVMFYLHTVQGDEYLRRKQLLEIQMEMLSKQLMLAREYVLDVNVCFARAKLQEKLTVQATVDTVRTCRDIIGQLSSGMFDTMIHSTADTANTATVWTCLSCNYEMSLTVKKCSLCSACKLHSEVECYLCQRF